MRSQKYILIPAAVLSVFLFLLGSCVTTTRNSLFVVPDKQVSMRQYDNAAKYLEGSNKAAIYRDQDQVLRYLDTGVLYTMGDEPKLAVARLNDGERLIEENYTKSISQIGTSFLLNDYALDYPGEAYEDVYLNVFKALDYIKLDQFDDAYVEIRRVGDKLTLLDDKYGRLVSGMNASGAKGSIPTTTTKFHNSALARYISALLYRAANKPSDARIDIDNLKKAFQDQPTLFDFPAPPVDTFLSTPQSPRLNVIAFAGLGPSKKATNLRLNTGNGVVFISSQREDGEGNLDLASFNAISAPGIVAGYNFKTELPYMTLRPSQVTRIQVTIDGAPVGSLSLIEKLDSVAVETFKLTETPTFFKTVLRTAIKGVAMAKAKEAAQNAASSSGPLMLLSLAGGVAADLAVDASEQADLRSARYFPGQAYVGEFQVPAGQHDVSIQYYSGRNVLLFEDKMPGVTIGQTGLNLATSYDLE